MIESNQNAPGHPGIPARWTSSAKSGVGTAINNASRVWFTLSHGILNEVYYPRVDQACTRDMGLIITDGNSFFSEEKRDASHQVEYLSPGIPAFKLTNICKFGHYKIIKTIITDPFRDVILQRTIFEPQQNSLNDYHLYVLLAPHLGNYGAGNYGWVGDYKGYPMIFAIRNNLALALACSAQWLNRSVGFVGYSDGWQDLKKHKSMKWFYTQANDGNIALTGEIDIAHVHGEFTLAIGFGLNKDEAGQRAITSLYTDFGEIKNQYVNEWKNWHEKIQTFNIHKQGSVNKDIQKISASVIKTHNAKRFPGGIIASLSIPWGFTKGDDDLGGYHLVWPRDLVEAAGGLLAIGAYEDARQVLMFLRVTQEADGSWPQNMWLDGRPYWCGIQIDETAFPILLAGLAYNEGALEDADLPHIWPMLKRAARFIIQNGPVTQQDRWEEDPGYSPFTLAVEIAALVVAADFAEKLSLKKMASYLGDTADTWNENIESWTYVCGTDLAKKFSVEGYYVRISPPDKADAASPIYGYVPIKNRPPGQNFEAAYQIISPDALALVRFGLRAADDPRIQNTIKVIDGLLKLDTPYGPCWYRYNDDGYGEHVDGDPFDGIGVGRAWPLLTGERAHYELAAGNEADANRLLGTLENFANPGGMIPEQIWDSEDIPERELFFGEASGSAMPLVWAHAEYVKLRRSLRDGLVFDTPVQTVQRYLKDDSTSKYAVWRFNHKSKCMKHGKILRIETLSPVMVHWSYDDWNNVFDSNSWDTGLGVHVTELSTGTLSPKTKIVFTLFWPDSNRWEGTNYMIVVEEE